MPSPLAPFTPPPSWLDPPDATGAPDEGSGYWSYIRGMVPQQSAPPIAADAFSPTPPDYDAPPLSLDWPHRDAPDLGGAASDSFMAASVPAGAREITSLDPGEESAFRAWAKANGISDVDHPDSHYDYRGYWQSTKGAPHRPGDHFPDTFKQHGHPTFSEESQYSGGRGDGGTWNGETFLAGDPAWESFLAGEQSKVDADPMPREVDPPSPVVDAYNAATPAQQSGATGGGLFGKYIGEIGDALTRANAAQPENDEVLVDSLEGDDKPENVERRVTGLADLYRHDPEARLRATVAREDMLNTEAMKRAAKANQDDIDAMERNAKAREQARAKVLADRAQIETDAKAMADSSPFESYWSSRSTAGKIGGVISAIFGGLMMAKTGGRNSGLDMMMKLADDDAAQKWKAIQARREMNGEAMGDADEEFRTQETLRKAGREQVANRIRTELAQLAPEGSTALTLSGALAQWDGANAEHAAKVDAENEKRATEVFKANSERMQAEAQMLNAQSLAAQRAAKSGGGSGGAGGGASGPAFTNSVTYEQLKNNGMRIPAGMKPGEAWPAKQYKAFIDLQAKNGNMDGEEAREANGKLEVQLKVNAVTIPGPDGKPLKNADGAILMGKTEPEAAATRAQMTATYAVVDMIDQVLDIRDRVGGESAAFNSDERQQLKVLEKQILMTIKKGTQGMSSDEDMKVLAGAVGAGDVASFRARAAGLKAGRQRTVQSLNNALQKTHGYTGDPITIPNKYGGPKAPRDPDVDVLVGREEGGDLADPAVEEVLRAKDVAPPTSAFATPGPRGPVRPGGPTTPGSSNQAYADAALDVSTGREPGLSGDERARMDAGLTGPQQRKLTSADAKIRKGGPEADTIVAKLVTIVTDDKVKPSRRDAVRALLVKLRADGVPAVANAAVQEALGRKSGVDEDTAEFDWSDD